MPATAMTAAEASSMPTAEAPHVTTTEVTLRGRTVPEGIVMPEVVMMVLPVMVVSEIRLVASTIPSIGVRGVSIAWITIVVIARFAASAHHKKQAE
jgi:hypothetical protein